MHETKPLVLLILDGWGYDEKVQYNAIASANTPQWKSWWKNYPHALLTASGEAVGLPPGQMGNSEVGHMHIGAGRTIYQDFTRINHAIVDGTFEKNATFIKLIQGLKANNKSLHVMGLLSSGGVHSHENHLFTFLKLCYTQQFFNVNLHLFLDGRDTPPYSALESLARLNEQLYKYPVAEIHSISGRYYAMDRDQRFERIEPVYRVITEGISQSHFSTAEEAISAFYAANTSDEFIPPTRIGNSKTIQDEDAIFFFNFRADRARQLTQAFLDPTFSGFSRPLLKLSHFASMTSYSNDLNTEVAFPHIALNHTLGEVLAKNGLRQLRIAETEKYAHVTFFLNGGIESTFPKEDRLLIPSPKITTYDLQPEMSAPTLTQKLEEIIYQATYDVIICNYANADMIGHTGKFSATVQAIECLDQCMKTIADALKKMNGNLLITADHGNAEMMFNEKTQQAHTAHTTQPVPFLYIGQGYHLRQATGSLIDIAPTLLTLLNIPLPPEMTGSSLLIKD